MEIRTVRLTEVDSTNTYGRLHFGEYPDGTLIVSDTQTAGRGRRGRQWISPPGRNIYASLLVKSLDNAFLAGAMCGLAVLDVVREYCPEAKTFLKWPNDVYVEDRKIAGILCESAEIINGRICGIVGGMGLNVNLSQSALDAIEQPAASLAVCTNREIDLKKVIEKLEKSLLRYYITGLKSELELFSLWKKENRLLGQRLELVTGAGERMTGIFADITSSGLMVLELADGLREFSCGDVKIDRESIDWNKV